jgi:hypothetical protein
LEAEKRKNERKKLRRADRSFEEHRSITSQGREEVKATKLKIWRRKIVAVVEQGKEGARRIECSLFGALSGYTAAKIFALGKQIIMSGGRVAINSYTDINPGGFHIMPAVTQVDSLDKNPDLRKPLTWRDLDRSFSVGRVFGASQVESCDYVKLSDK